MRGEPAAVPAGSVAGAMVMRTFQLPTSSARFGFMVVLFVFRYVVDFCGRLLVCCFNVFFACVLR